MYPTTRNARAEEGDDDAVVINELSKYKPTRRTRKALAERGMTAQ